MSWDQKVAQSVLLGPTSNQAGMHLSRSPSAGSWWVIYCLFISQRKPTAALFSLHRMGKNSTLWDGKALGTLENNALGCLGFGVFLINIYYEKTQLSLSAFQVKNLTVICWLCRCSIVVSLQKWSGFQIGTALSTVIWLISHIPLQQKDRIQLLLQFWLSN